MKVVTTLSAATVLVLFSASASAALDDAAAMALMKKSGCAACHTVDKKLVGPTYKDVAAKRKGSDPAELVKAVRAGSKGVYGTIAMPANPVAKIADADLNDLVTWIMTK
jgi:cytochrome c